MSVAKLCEGVRPRPVRVGRLVNVVMGVLLAGAFAGAAHAQPIGAQAGSAVLGQGKVVFLPHRAAYEVALLKTRRTPGMASVRGRILYEFAGNTCEGYSTEFRQVSELDGGEGQANLTDLRSTSFESADGKTFRFNIENRVNNALTSRIDGMAERSAKGIVVKLKQPAEKTVTLDPEIVFPTEQVVRIIEAARAGKSLLELKVYDGSDTGEKIYKTLTVIGQPIPPGKETDNSDAAANQPALDKATRWPVTVSYFDQSEKGGEGEQTPTYAMSFQLYEHGVSRALTLDYSDFVVSGKMSKFEPRPIKPCP